MSFLHTYVGMTGTGTCDLPGLCSQPGAEAGSPEAQHLVLIFPDFEQMSKPTTDS